MTFATVQSVTRGNNNTNTTNRNVTLPATIDAGDILIVLFVNDGDATVTWDNTTAGTWTSLFSTASGTAVRLTAYWKTAAGTEDGAVLDIATSAIERSAWQIYRISGAQSVEAGTPATGSGATPDPPSFSPSWGSADALWLPVFGSDNQTGDNSGFAYPTNYTTHGIYDEAANAAGCGVGSSYRDNAASSENPAAYTLGASLAWVANTIAIQPASTSISAAGSITLDALSLSAAATLKIASAAAITLGDLSTTSAATVALAGVTSIALADLTVSATGAVALKASASITLGDLSTSATGELEAEVGSGSASITFEDVALAATAALPITGAAAITLDGLELSSAGAVAIKASASITLGALTLSAASDSGAIYTPSGLRRVTLEAVSRSVAIEAFSRSVALTGVSRRVAIAAQSRRIAA
jgi:hypothetical protein